MTRKMKNGLKIAIAVVTLIIVLAIVFALSSLNNPSPNSLNPQPTPTPTVPSTPTPTPTPSTPTSTPESTPTPIPDVPIPTFTLTQAIRTDINSGTGETYESICANITIKNEDVVKHYEIQYKGHYGDSWIPVTFDLEKSTSAYTSILSEWLPNGEWDFKVKAYDGVGAFNGRSSDWSEIKTITVNEEDN